MIEIPMDALTNDALRGVLEEFASRDGTDYGEVEISLADKVAQLRAQLTAGELVLVFDEEFETTQLVPRDQLPREGHNT